MTLWYGVKNPVQYFLYEISLLEFNLLWEKGLEIHTGKTKKQLIEARNPKKVNEKAAKQFKAFFGNRKKKLKEKSLIKK